MNFYPRPPRGGRPFHFVGQNLPGYFYPRPPRGGRPAFMPASPTARAFLSTPSARRATGASHGRSTIACYFYPRPPRGGRLRAFFVLIRHEFQFLSTPSARRATFQCIFQFGVILFLSTPSARRATWLALSAFGLSTDFYPRPPRGGRPVVLVAVCTLLGFLSTPSARRATGSIVPGLSLEDLFLSTPSARRATGNCTTRLS